MSDEDVLGSRENDYKDAVMQDLYNEMSSDSDEEIDVLKQVRVQEKVDTSSNKTDEDRKALAELYKEQGIEVHETPVKAAQPVTISQKLTNWFQQAKSIQPAAGGALLNLKSKLQEIKLEDIDRKIQDTIESHFGDRQMADPNKQHLSSYLHGTKTVAEPATKFTIDEEEKIEPEPEQKPIQQIFKIDIVKRQEVNLTDFELIKTRKQVKRPTMFQSVSIAVHNFQLAGGFEERLLTVLGGHLLVIKAFAQPKKLSLFSQNLPTEYPQGIVKSVTELNRLFKIDVLVAEKGGRQDELEIVLHFVNAQKNPMLASLIKRFNIKNDNATKEFLRKFEEVVTISSPFYQK